MVENNTVGSDYPQQQRRLRALLKEYQAIELGMFGVIAIETALNQAEIAIVSGDIVEILLAYSAMVAIES